MKINHVSTQRANRFLKLKIEVFVTKKTALIQSVNSFLKLKSEVFVTKVNILKLEPD